MHIDRYDAHREPRTEAKRRPAALRIDARRERNEETEPDISPLSAPPTLLTELSTPDRVAGSGRMQIGRMHLQLLASCTL